MGLKPQPRPFKPYTNRQQKTESKKSRDNTRLLKKMLSD